MNKEQFWSIMQRSGHVDTDIMLSNLEDELDGLSSTDVILFCTYLGAYMEKVCGSIWLDMACKVINGYVSDDTSLYFALWVISRGETVLLNALLDPDSLADISTIPWGNAEFEMLTSVAMEYLVDMDIEEVQDLCQGIHLEIASTIKFKNNKQIGDYQTFDTAMEDIPNVLPKLIRRAEIEGFNWKNLF